ncbi:MAG: mechanosensitive ion channel family protein [bacterium]
MEQILEGIGKQLIGFLPKGGMAIIVFIIFWGIGTITQRFVCRAGEKMEETKKNIFQLTGSAVKVGLVLFGAVTALGTMGVNVSALVAGLGLSGFALGFALRDALSNLISGAMIIIYRPFQNGDRISVAGCEGEVIEINLRYTALQGEEKVCLIPNATLFTNVISIIKKV